MHTLADLTFLFYHGLTSCYFQLFYYYVCERIKNCHWQFSHWNQSSASRPTLISVTLHHLCRLKCCVRYFLYCSIVEAMLRVSLSWACWFTCFIVADLLTIEKKKMHVSLTKHHQRRRQLFFLGEDKRPVRPEAGGRSISPAMKLGREGHKAARTRTLVCSL